MAFRGHDLKVGDTVKLVGLERHPFAGMFLDESKTAKVVEAGMFGGDMPYVHVSQNENDFEGVAFADEDLAILVKLEEN